MVSGWLSRGASDVGDAGDARDQETPARRPRVPKPLPSRDLLRKVPRPPMRPRNPPVERVAGDGAAAAASRAATRPRSRRPRIWSGHRRAAGRTPSAVPRTGRPSSRSSASSSRIGACRNTLRSSASRSWSRTTNPVPGGPPPSRSCARNGPRIPPPPRPPPQLHPKYGERKPPPPLGSRRPGRARAARAAPAAGNAPAGGHEAAPSTRGPLDALC